MPGGGPGSIVGVSGTRYRCVACGNLTRFDVTVVRRTKAFYHYTLGGDLDVEEPQVLDEHVEHVACRWCGAGGRIVEIPAGEPFGGDPATESVTPPS